MAFSLDIRCHSEIGMVRKNNQDSGYVSPTMLVVADGMGGAAAGDLASTVAVKQVARADSRRQGEEMLTLLAGAVSAANDELADLVAWDRSLEGMGTTFCGAMFDGAQLGLVHIGDSRGYLLRDGALSRMTHDDSWVQSLVDEGRITEQEAAVHPHRSLLLKVLNGQPQHTPDTKLVDVQLGDRVLFCSDGLCGFVSDPVIERIVSHHTLDDAMAMLVTEAHAAGAPDNVTVVLAEIVPHSDELEAMEPKIIGAAEITAVPDHEVTAPLPITAADMAEQTAPRPGTPRPGAPRHAARDDGTPLLFDSEAEESARYAPIDPDARHRLRPWLLTIAAVLVLALAGTLGSRAFLNRQFYVGEKAGTVAIYRGVPDSLLWLRLSSVVERTDINVGDLPRLYRSSVISTIDVDSLESAQATVAELRIGAENCRAVRERANTPGSASPTPGATTPGTSTPGFSTPGAASASTPAVSPSGSASASATPGTASEAAPTGSPSPSSGVSLPKVTEDDCS
ncbi:PP2C-family Ser/Thr phosphatase [Acidipropionibacterium jensenii]|uniref:PP2C-family Ser/Thr phosphatase n=2 Tax=Acidipropionibacterium jensenii TaxID=1749 RepID=A0A448NYK1_9ACTN|nr:PP2C-family Ser/Thr phosphatase [Acidipropionibacterium jensenii]